jgi:hypothetical protein
VSGLVLVTGAAGGGPDPAGRRMAGLLLDRGVRCVPSYRQPSRRHSHSVQFPEQRCSACGFRQAGVVSARGMGYRYSRAAARPPRGTARVFFREVLAGHDAQACEPSSPP